LKTVHDNAGHFGTERVADFLHHLWWPGKTNDISNYVESCCICMRRKGNYGKHAKPFIGHLLRGSKPFEIIYCDFVHMPQTPSGKRYILTIIDSFTRFFYGHATSRDRAIDAAKGLIQYMLEYGIPHTISSDRGTHFVNSIIEELCKDMSIGQNLHTAYRPQSSGNIERSHRTLKNALWALAADRNCSWIDALPYVRRAMNMSKNSATGCSPYFAIYGKEPIIVGALPPGNDNRSTEPLSYGNSVRDTLEKAHKLIQITNEEADRALEQRINPIHPPEQLETGDLAYLHRPESAKAKETHLSWIGPFTILKSNGQICLINRDGTEQWVHRFHLRKKIERRSYLEPIAEPIIDITDESDISESGRSENTGEQVTLEDSEHTESSDERRTTPTPSPRRRRERRPPARFSPRMRGKFHEIS